MRNIYAELFWVAKSFELLWNNFLRVSLDWREEEWELAR